MSVSEAQPQNKLKEGHGDALPIYHLSSLQDLKANLGQTLETCSFCTDLVIFSCIMYATFFKSITLIMLTKYIMHDNQIILHSLLVLDDICAFQYLFTWICVICACNTNKYSVLFHMQRGITEGDEVKISDVQVTTCLCVKLCWLPG